MPFLRPSLTGLRGQVAQDLAVGVAGGDGLLRNSVLLQLAWAFAGLAHGHYGYLDWIARRAVPWTAEEEHLEGWAALVGVLRKDAEPAAGFASFAAADGAVVPRGTPVVRDDGFRYLADEDAFAGGGGVTVAVTADAAGAAGNADAGVALALGRAVQGVVAQGGAPAALVGGADAETDESLRARMLAAYAEPPQGGAESDYLRWALEVPGVTRAWVARNAAGPGTVVVYVMLDDANADRQGLPVGRDGVSSEDPRARDAMGDQARVADHLWPLQPVTALVYAVSPLAHPVDVRVQGMSADTAAIRAAVAANLRAMFRAQASPGGVIDVAAFYGAVDSAPGVTRFNLVSPTAAVEAPPGHIAVLGAVSYS